MDKIFESWLEQQYKEGIALAAESDALALIPEPGGRPPRRFVAEFASPTMVRSGIAVTRADGFAVLFQFPDDYLRSAPDAARIVNLLGPYDLFHPNVSAPFLCLGHIAPGTSLLELIFRAYELLTFQKLTPREDDALNRGACVWARRNTHLFPLTVAPLRRRAVAFSIDEVPSAETAHVPLGI